ncbi:relaxosome protein TraM [Providencia alcalifaciens]|uniref:relaxosome protein TraM n=1 Tax=Providencia alcalifaciens TaxID=126385 RepID=UPI003D2D03D7
MKMHHRPQLAASENKGNKRMPRQHIYMKQKTLDGIRNLVDKRKADGADANISSVGSELLDIGLRVVENLEKDKEGDDGLTLEERYKKQVLEEVIKSRQCIQVLFKMMFDLTEIKDDNRYNYREYIEDFKNRTQSILDEFFQES